ncbi:hypothetical protein [Catenulispora rubra]|uniref:hypothetical protein n=1 Tax=Catenulispora rubra TaxID=280293 RepID=UPI001892241F|nr:hypothetical protein [Catenulispora rubra]
MTSALTSLAGTLLRGVLPYPDLSRRRRVRASARKLVVCRRWPEDSAVTGQDLAQLALLRVLYLQEETRRATRSRQHEAAVLLARSALEACILGLYCLHTPAAFPGLRRAHLKAGLDSLGFLVDDGLIPQQLLEQAVATLGTPGRATNVKDMAAAIDKATGGRDAARLYSRIYIPTSTFFVHANAASLLRHVGPEDSLTAQPSKNWARRSPVRLADACVGLLAAAIAADRGSPPQEFATYARDHIARVLTPMVVMAGKQAAGRSGLARQAAILLEIRRMQRYLQAPQVLNDSAQQREAKVRALFGRIVPAMVGPDVPTAAIQLVVDHFVEVILRETEQLHSPHA